MLRSENIVYSDSIFKSGEDVFINKVIVKESTPFHCHDFIEIAFVKSGVGLHKIDKDEYSISTGDVFLINYDVPHQFIPDLKCNNSDLIIYNCIFKPGFLDPFLVECYNFTEITNYFLLRSLIPDQYKDHGNKKLLGFYHSGINDLFEKMYTEYETKEPGYIGILRAYIIQFIITVFRLMQKSDMLKAKKESQHQNLIERTLAHIKDHFSHDLKLEDMSFMAFLSPSYFCRQFKQYTGLTPTEYIQKLRIEEACELLKETNKKVIEIAYDVGYKDVKFFTEIFKRITGKTPLEYRKS